MSPASPKTSFLSEAAFGFLVSVMAAAVAAAGPLLLPAPFVGRALVAGIGLICVLRAIRRSDEKTGRVVALAVWVVVTVLAWASGIGLPAFVALHAALIWLARSLFSYARVLEAVLDLGLTALAVSFGVWAGLRTESVLLAAWCFLLIQALYPAIPGLAAGVLTFRQRASSGIEDDRAFTDAYRAADEALRRLASRH